MSDATSSPPGSQTQACCKWFTTLDLLSGYWQVAVDPKDHEKTAFTTYDGLFEFKKMSFGLCNAPATFQRLMDLVLAGLQWNNCLIYLDDVLIIGKTFEEHLSNLNLVFNRLRDVGLKFKLSKCVKLSRVKLVRSQPLLHLLLSTTIVCKRFVYKVSRLSQTVKIKHMKFFTWIINNTEHLPCAFANCDTILLYYNSIWIHWILWPFPFTPKFFSHSPLSTLFDIHDIHEHN